MGRLLIKLHDERDNKDYFLEWSTVVDAPMTYGMSLQELKSYIKEQYGLQGLESLDDRLKRVEETGTSSELGDDVDSLIRVAQLNGGSSKDDIIEKYCRNRNS